MVKVDSFPYPFKGEVYRYSNNTVPLDEPSSVEITSSYQKEIKLKRDLLTHHPERCFQSRRHTLKAQWEITELVIQHLTSYYPQLFSLEKNERKWTFHNHILNEQTTMNKQPLYSGMNPLYPWNHSILSVDMYKRI